MMGLEVGKYYEYMPLAFELTCFHIFPISIITSIGPLNGSQQSCQSYFIPGPVVTDPTMPPGPTINGSDGTVLIVNDVPGYQIDYSPVTSDDPILLPDVDCNLYGMEWAAIQICVKQVGTSLIVCETKIDLTGSREPLPSRY